MKLLLHTCCAPCLLYPARYLRDLGQDFTVFAANPNIHPYQEYERRTTQLAKYCADRAIAYHEEKPYAMREFLAQVAAAPDERCPICYRQRLLKTATFAHKYGFSHFSTTLLYSRYQNHELIKKIGEEMAAAHGLTFFYHDFREGWSEGIKISKEMAMYRQQYCGCIYSEQERYDPQFQNRKKK
ncbi:MAG: epoxyqueuosine reductase QueH [Desulfobulbaceae bacterium]|jgi:predicted adenine nucleotide alpha hydrolase (AANH) superfamily ATPase|nr:epoxyqueuosine reductase QueH [Desulfobulbaceae bacterium]